MVAVAYERWSLTRGFQCSDLAEKTLVLIFGKLVAEERWLLTRGGRNRWFDYFNASFLRKLQIIADFRVAICICSIIFSKPLVLTKK